MKISIALSLLILGIGAVLGWHAHQQQTTDRTSYEQLLAEAAQAGITLDPTQVKDAMRGTKRERERKNTGVDVKKVSAEFIAYAKEMDATEHKSGPRDEAALKKWLKINDSIMSLNAAQLRVLIADVRGRSDLKEGNLQDLVSVSTMALAKNHPRDALMLLTESADILKNSSLTRFAVSSSLTNWAKQDPTAALEWVRTNAKRFPNLLDDNAQYGLISGTAGNDPKLAFKLIGELGLKDGDAAIDLITRAVKTQQERTATLAALRAHLATLPEGAKRDETSKTALRALGRNAVEEGFEAGSKWIDSAGLTSNEISEICSNSLKINRAESGQWVEWMGAKLSGDKSATGIRRLVSDWTEGDHQAAGKWLAATPAGPTKNISIRSYAETVAKYEPETAAQWAMTLPPGQDRNETLKRIYEKWPQGDETAKAAFGKLHRIN